MPEKILHYYNYSLFLEFEVLIIKKKKLLVSIVFNSVGPFKILK